MDGFYNLIYGNDFNKDIVKDDFSNIDNFINDNAKTAQNGVNHGFCGISFNELCMQYALNELKLKGVAVLVYKFLASHYINNDIYKNKQFVCCSLSYLAYYVHCSFASIKRVIKKFCDSNIIIKCGSGINGRNKYVINKIFDYSVCGLVLSAQNKPLDKKSSKKINLKKEKEIIENINVLKSSKCCPSWLRLYAPNSQVVQNELVSNKDDLENMINIAKFNCWLDD